MPARFVAVGTIGFVVDGGVLQALVLATGMSPLAARLVSFLCASVVTWRLNRRFTFPPAPEGRGALGEWLRYLSASVTGATVNYAVFAVLVIGVPFIAAMPVLGVAVGSLAGMIVNFTLYRLIVFRGTG